MMDTETLKSEIRTLIGKSKTEAAIKLLSEQPLGRLDREAVILQGQYARVKEELQLDVVSREEAERKINQINLAVLDLAERVGQPSKMPVSTAQGKQWLWLLLIPAVLAVGYIVFSRSQHPAALNEAGLTAEETAASTDASSNGPAEDRTLRVQFVLDKMRVIRDGDNGSDGDFYWDIRVNSESIDERAENDDIGLPEGAEYPFNIKKTFDFKAGRGAKLDLIANISENDDFMNGDDDHLTIIETIPVDKLGFPEKKVATFSKIGTHKDGSPQVELYWRVELVSR